MNEDYLAARLSDPPETTITPPSEYLSVLEIFSTPMQGEGLLTGQPSTFVRFSGCTVGCAWCDTKFSWRAGRGEIYSPEVLAELVRETDRGTKHIVITGGEPLEQPGQALVRFLNRLMGYHVTVETSGVKKPPEYAERLVSLWSVSPKLQGAQSHYTTPYLPYWDAYPGKVQFKFVITDEEDLSQVYDLIALHRIQSQVILQPCTPQGASSQEVLDKTRWLAETVNESQFLKLVPNILIRPQMHYLLWGSRRGI